MISDNRRKRPELAIVGKGNNPHDEKHVAAAAGHYCRNQNDNSNQAERNKFASGIGNSRRQDYDGKTGNEADSYQAEPVTCRVRG